MTSFWPPEGFDSQEAFAAERAARKKRRAKRWESPAACEHRGSCSCVWHKRKKKGAEEGREPKPLWDGAMEKGARCASCGQLEEDERPLLGEDGRLHCPRLDCDAVVTILDPGHPDWLPGGKPYAGIQYGWAADTVRYWKRGLHLKVVPARGTYSTTREAIPTYGPVPTWIESAWNHDRVYGRCTGCGAMIPKKDLAVCEVYVTSGAMRLGWCPIKVCMKCCGEVPVAATVEQIDSCTVHPWRRERSGRRGSL